MYKNRRNLLKAIGGSSALAAFAGCVSLGDDSPEDIDEEADATMWIDMEEAEGEDFMSMADEFEAETDLEVALEEPGGELDEQLDTAIPAGDGPDGWVWAHDWVGRFAVRDEPAFLYDASDDIDLDLDVYTEPAQEAVQFDGGLYGLPFASETVSLFYNEDMVDEPPETLDEMIDIMDEFHDPEAGEYGLSYPVTDPYFVSGFLQAYGGNIFDEENLEVTLDSDEVKQGLGQLERLFDYVPADPGYESQIVAFADGLAPFAINGPWEIGNLDDEIDNLGVTTLPTIEGNHPRNYTGIQMIYFSAMLEESGDDAVDALTEFAEWYTTNEEAVTNNADRHGLIPVLQDVVDGNDLDGPVQAFAEQVDRGTPMPTHPDMDNVWDPLEEALTRVFNGDQDGDDALDQAAEEIRDSL
ncbi:extracellular solute-binding protein [Halorubrum gandharaense]